MILKFKGLVFLRLGVGFLLCGISNYYIWWLVFLCLRVSDSYDRGLVFLCLWLSHSYV